MEVCPYSYFWWYAYFLGPRWSFVVTDEFRVTKITSTIGVYLSVFNLFQKDVNQVTLYKYSRLSFQFCWMWNFPWIKLSWHSCSIRDKLGCLNWFWRFLCEGLSSFNLKRFYYSYAWSCSLCERRTTVCRGLVFRKLCRFLLIFLTSFTSHNASFLFPLSITFFVFMHGFWFYFI